MADKGLLKTIEKLRKQGYNADKIADYLLKAGFSRQDVYETLKFEEEELHPRQFARIPWYYWAITLIMIFTLLRTSRHDEAISLAFALSIVGVALIAIVQKTASRALMWTVYLLTMSSLFAISIISITKSQIIAASLSDKIGAITIFYSAILGIAMYLKSQKRTNVMLNTIGAFVSILNAVAISSLVYVLEIAAIFQLAHQTVISDSTIYAIMLVPVLVFPIALYLINNHIIDRINHSHN